jgi:toxin secretion/phage lysis holin
VLEIFRELTTNADTKLEYALAVICFLMTLDYFTGMAKAYVAHKINSNKGINGIIRKGCSLIMLLTLIPVSVLLPNTAGDTVLWTIFVGYALAEFQSIIENLDAMDINVYFFKLILPKSEEAETEEKQHGAGNSGISNQNSKSRGGESSTDSTDKGIK